MTALEQYQKVAESDAGPATVRWGAAGAVIGLLIVAAAFAILPLLIVLLTLLVWSGLQFIIQTVRGNQRGSGLAMLAGTLTLASVLFTDFGFSSLRPRTIVAWHWLIPALFAHAAILSIPLWPERFRDLDRPPDRP